MVEAAADAISIKVDSEHIGAAGVPSVLQQVRTRKAAGYLLDLSSVRTIDSGGLGFLASVCRHAGDNAMVLLVGASLTLRDALARAGLADLFTNAPDVNRAEELLRLHYALRRAQSELNDATPQLLIASEEYGKDQCWSGRGTADRDRHIPEPAPGG